MATFVVQIETLTGLAIDGSSAPTETEVTQYLHDGVLDVTAKWIRQNPGDKERFMRVTSESTSQGGLTSDSQIVSVVRESGADNDWMACKKISLANQAVVVNTGSVFLASKNDPVFAVESNGVINVYPAPDNGGADSYKVYYVNNEPKGDGTSDDLAYGHTTIGYFPDDKIPLVVMYAGMHSLQNKAAALHASVLSKASDALDAANTEIDKIDALATLMNAEIHEAVGLTDSSSSGIKTAVDGMATAVSKFRADASDPALFGDESQYTTSQGMTRVKNALDNAQGVINDNQPSATTDAYGAQAAEDIELVTSALAIAAQELARADAHISEFTAASEVLSKENSTFGDGVSSISTWIDSKSTVWTGFSTEISSRLEAAAAYLAEAEKRNTISSKEYEWYNDRYNKIQQDYYVGLGIMTEGKK